MRYEKHHKAQTHERIVQTASTTFREQGFSAAGLKAVLAAAGLTKGGFYNHFRSKDALAAEAVAASFAGRTALLQTAIDTGGGVEAVIRHYFTARHRDNPGAGCPSSALASEVARQSSAVRDVFSKGVERFLGLMETQWPDLPAPERRRRAVSIYSLMVGAMQLARVNPDDEESAHILEDSLQTALMIARA